MGKYITETQRYQLEIMLQDKIPVKQIGEMCIYDLQRN